MTGLLGAILRGSPKEGTSELNLEGTGKSQRGGGAGELCLKAKDSVILNQSIRHKYCAATVEPVTEAHSLPRTLLTGVGTKHPVTEKNIG